MTAARRRALPRGVAGWVAACATLLIVASCTSPAPAAPAAPPAPAGDLPGPAIAAAPAAAAPAPRCGTSLQTLVNAAPAGSVLTVPGCTYRGALRITKPLTIVGRPGAEIRGNDVWSAWNGRVSVKALRAMAAGGECMNAATACPWVEQVLFDGVRLARVAGDPGPGQFALDASRHVVLGQAPAGHTVEVTTRQFWMEISSSDVTVAGFVMRYAANRAQTGALRVDDGVNRVTIRDVDLGYSSGAAVAFGGANDSTLLRASVHDNGQLGVHLGGEAPYGHGNRVLDSRIYRNNTARFDPEWEAGGLKATAQSGLLIAGTEVYGNVGPGIWCDIYCSNVTFRDNRVHDNTYAGIMFEVSTGARIYDNVAYRNGAGKAEWGWGAGILVSSSGGADVHDNVLAWNARSGVSIISQQRTDWPDAQPTDNYVHDNTTLALYGTWLMFWAQDYAGPLFEPGSNNRGSGNRYWIAGGPDGDRFAWEDGTGSLSVFNATPGDEAASYLTTSEKNALLGSAGIPPAP